LRQRARHAGDVPTALIYSVRQTDDLIFRDELLRRASADKGFALFATVTREAPNMPPLRHGRVDQMLVREALQSLGGIPRRTYVCGSNAFVDTASELLLAMGVPFASIRTERYGGAPA